MMNSDDIARACIEHYNNLTKKGKPESGREWTLMAAVVKQENGNLSVVTMATGTKCIGKSQMSKTGDVITDSHAEILARRAFIRYLFDQLKASLSGNPSIFIPAGTEDVSPGTWSLRDGVSFHFFTSHTPCGDASIFPKEADMAKPEAGKITEETRQSQKRQQTHNNINSVKKRRTLDGNESEKRVTFLMPTTSEFNAKTSSSVQGDTHQCENADKVLAEGRCKVDTKSDSPSKPSTQTQSSNQEHLAESSPSQVSDKNKEHISSCITKSIAFNDQHVTSSCQDSSSSLTSGEVVLPDKHQSSEKCLLDNSSGVNTPSDIHRTGAKCVPGGVQDSCSSGVDYHTVRGVTSPALPVGQDLKISHFLINYY